MKLIYSLALSTNLATSCERLIPEAAQSKGYMLWDVKPGSVFISFMKIESFSSS